MSTRIVLIEDEALAAGRLAKMIKKCMPEAEIVAICDSKESAIRYLQTAPLPDLMFLDIQLGDGLSFDIFQTIDIHCPVIFTTAYDEFALKAFELNSIDYLLKPIHEENLQRSLAKFEMLRQQSVQTDIRSLLPLIDKNSRSYKKRFLLAIGDKLVSVHSSDIAYFYSLEKDTYLVDFKGMHYATESSLDKVEESMDPARFFRVNRQFLVSSEAIAKMYLLSKSRIKIHLKPECKEEVLVSSARTHAFREWMDG